MPLKIKVASPRVSYTAETIHSTYPYQTTLVETSGDASLTATPQETSFEFKTSIKIPRLGMMLVGLGGNNGSTLTASMIANRLRLRWPTKEGEKSANYVGSITQSSTVCLGTDSSGIEQYVALGDLLPMVHPNDIAIDGWDINSANLAEAMERARVLDYNLQVQLKPHMEKLQPRPSIYCPDFIAANQADRANNVLSGTKKEMVKQLRADIRDFKEKEKLDKVIILWTANTERFCDVRAGLNLTAGELLESIDRNEDEVSPSSLFAVASILEGCTYINGSPQNSLIPGVVDLAEKYNVFVGGDDFKSGQTKLKSVLVDFLVSAGIKPRSIVSYNHLGNNDGKNLSAPKQFRSKEISKSNVVDDMVESNRILYGVGEKPDHCVVIKYVPFVGDSKRAMDEYTSEIFMGGLSTIAVHNTCEDSLLASPIILDLVILAEMCERISMRKEGDTEYTRFNSVLSLLSYLLKAPMVPKGTPVVNALFRQRACIENIFRACIGLAPQSHMLLEHKLASAQQRDFALRKADVPVVEEKVSQSENSAPAAAKFLPLERARGIQAVES